MPTEHTGLVPCPGCGGTVFNVGISKIGPGHVVRCTTCLGPVGRGGSLQLAIDDWRAKVGEESPSHAAARDRAKRIENDERAMKERIDQRNSEGTRAAKKTKRSTGKKKT